ncbi:uncharacterized protein LOC142765153 [Rhipicephalus microplus]|uniref:uncharacterized protein LOC142765153 n=1 Tax=Rhipicephalus microplus TaxID=6941 RepID=UPI003F6AA73A
MSIRVVVSAILPRQASLRKCQWALSVGELEAFNTDAKETNAILQALCHKNGYGFVDGTCELMGTLKADGVHPTKHGSQLLGCLLRAAIKQASKDLEASQNGALQQQHQKEKDHKKLGFQYSDQSKRLAQYWNNSPPSDRGPPDACGVTSTVSPQSEGVVLCKGSSAADTSPSTLRGDLRVEKGVEEIFL